MRGEGGGVQRIVELENGRGRIVLYKFDPHADENVAAYAPCNEVKSEDRCEKASGFKTGQVLFTELIGRALKFRDNLRAEQQDQGYGLGA